MRSHPGKTMSIYDIPGIVNDALPLAATPKNIQAGFKCTGIYPLNANIFSDSDFSPSSVTDRELEPKQNQCPTSPIHRNCAAATSTPQLLLSILPNPKAGPRIASKRGRKKRKSCVLTDTPMLNEVRAEEEERLLRKKPKPSAEPKPIVKGRGKKKVLAEVEAPSDSDLGRNLKRDKLFH